MNDIGTTLASPFYALIDFVLDALSPTAGVVLAALTALGVWVWVS